MHADTLSKDILSISKNLQPFTGNGDVFIIYMSEKLKWDEKTITNNVVSLFRYRYLPLEKGRGPS